MNYLWVLWHANPRSCHTGMLEPDPGECRNPEAERRAARQHGPHGGLQAARQLSKQQQQPLGIHLRALAVPAGGGGSGFAGVQIGQEAVSGHT